MTTAVIVQARNLSTRFPGKVLKPLNNHTVLEEVLFRCRNISRADVVVCAIPDRAEDEPLIPLVERVGARLVRGSTSDVLGRYKRAADTVDADIIMRVTSDCPLIDPALCDEVLDLLATKKLDYASNNMPPSFPHGLDCEAFTIDALSLADARANTKEDREHVTPWLRRANEIRRDSLRGPEGPALAQRWTLDYPEDYEFFCAVFSLMRPGKILRWPEVMELIDRRPDIFAINASRHTARYT